jgi:hypothetical protein
VQSAWPGSPWGPSCTATRDATRGDGTTTPAPGDSASVDLLEQLVAGTVQYRRLGRPDRSESSCSTPPPPSASASRSSSASPSSPHSPSGTCPPWRRCPGPRPTRTTRRAATSSGRQRPPDPTAPGRVPRSVHKGHLRERSATPDSTRRRTGSAPAGSHVATLGSGNWLAGALRSRGPARLARGARMRCVRRLLGRRWSALHGEALSRLLPVEARRAVCRRPAAPHQHRGGSASGQ